MDSTEIDYSRKWYVMAAVGMGIFLATVDGSIVNVALPTLVRELNADFPTVQWVVLAYLLTLTTLMLGVGRLADIRGKRPIYALGFIVFTIGSVLCGLAPTVYWLIAFRVLQAVGASMVLALGMAIVTEGFPPSERGRALGISGAIVSAGIVIGPTVGGLLIDALSWNWIFFVNLPVGIIGTLMVIRFVPLIRPPGGQQFDIWGALTFFLSLLALLLALTMGQSQGFNHPWVLGLFLASAVLMLVFVWIETHHPQPAMDLRLFQNDLFSFGLITGFATFVAIAGTTFLMPFYLENVLGYDTRQVGLLLAVVPVVLAVVSPLSGVMSDRFGTRPITVLGLLILLGGYLAMTTLTTATTATGFILRFLPVGIGMGTFQSPNNSAIMGSAPRSQLGVTSGMLAITRTLGQTTGIALLGALWARNVAAHALESQPGSTLQDGVVAAPAEAQAVALQDLFVILSFLILLALGLSIYALVQSRHSETRKWEIAQADDPQKPPYQHQPRRGP